jgi:hypothetical protein
LVWVGRAANYASKLAALPETYSSYITADVYNNMHTSAKTSNGEGKEMWTPLTWNEFNDARIYGSSWRWTV